MPTSRPRSLRELHYTWFHIHSPKEMKRLWGNASVLSHLTTHFVHPPNGFIWLYLPNPGIEPRSPGASDGKESACNARDLGLTPGLERSPGEGNGNLLQWSCLENPMENGAWQVTIHRVTRVGHDWETNTFTVFPTLYAFQLLKPSSLFKLWWKSILYPWLQKRHLREQRHKAWKETEKQKRALNISSQTIILKYILDISFFLTAPHPYSSCQPQRPSKSASIVPILYPCHCYSNSAVIFPWLLSWAKSCPLIIRMLKS